MKKVIIFLFIVHASLFTFHASEARIIHVPADQPTIQAGIDAAFDGDTVLVSPGTYFENIQIGGTGITIASHFLTTGDPSYIVQTVIDGAHDGYVVYISAYVDQTTSLCGFTITNGNESGICCDYSEPVLKNLIITGNSASSGGGISCHRSDPVLIDVKICQNNALYNGGGFYCSGNSEPVFKRVTITENEAVYEGGGIYIANDATVNFDPVNLSNIYLNKAPKGSDLFSNSYSGEVMQVNLDTFTVLYPNNYFVATTDKFEFSINHGKIEQVDGDLYVSPQGDDQNSGLTESDPLKTIYAACRKILPDSMNTIHLLEGIYSSTSNGEQFPVELCDYIRIQGVSPQLVTLDAEMNSGVIHEYLTVGTYISGMTITGGHADIGAGVNSSWSKPVLKDLIVKNNIAYGDSQSAGGGGMYLFSDTAVVEKVTLTGNSTTGEGGGLSIENTAMIVLIDVTATNNSAETGGGIYINANAESIRFDSLNRCNIYHNSASAGNDICTNGTEYVYKIYADTFSVLQPTAFYAEPVCSFIFDINYGLNELVNADIYVSPEGNNNNTGLTENDPLKTIHHAFSRIMADSVNPHTIHLLEGTYTKSARGEIFPVNMIDYISLSGTSRDNVILDAEELTTVLKFNSVKGSDLSNLTIEGGKLADDFEWPDHAGGINCHSSDPSIQNVIIRENHSNSYYGGGGMYCNNSKPVLASVDFINNTAENGAGLYCDNESDLFLDQVNFKGNTAKKNGGGLYNDLSTVHFQDVIFQDNNASDVGGGAYIKRSTADFKDVVIKGNSALAGGGLCFYHTTAGLDHVTIDSNIALESGGGIYYQNGNVQFMHSSIRNNKAAETGGGVYLTAGTNTYFDPVERCNIYYNYSKNKGRDFYSDPPVNLVLDTFTVLFPVEYLTYPMPSFQVDIWHGLIEQYNADVYVSPFGDNGNNGLTPEEPLKNIDMAFIKIIPADSNVHTVNLLEGTYSFSSTGEIFPLDIPEYINLYGKSRDEVILQGENLADVILFNNNSTSTLKGLTVSDGNTGISCYHSSPELNNISVKGNNNNGIYCNQNSGPKINNSIIENNSAGIYMENSCHPVIEGTMITENNVGICSEDSSPTIQDVVISKNSSGGGMVCSNSYPVLMDVDFLDNNNGNYGGALSCSDSQVQLDQVRFIGNNGFQGGGFFCGNTEVTLQNVTFSGNYASYGGGLYFEGSVAQLKKVNIFNNEVWNEGGGIYSTSDSQIDFDTNDRCNIYLNRAVTDGNDLFSDHFMQVAVDTFTVLTPTDYQAYPLVNFNFDILHGLIPQVNADVYVSPDGLNSNSGLTAEDPVRNIYYAMNKVLPDSLNPRKVNLLEGIYSPGLTGEIFPLSMPNYIALSGISKEGVVLDAENQSGIILVREKPDVTISGMTLMNADKGSAIQLSGSHASLKDLIVKNNKRGGVVSWSNDTTTLINVSIHDNKNYYGGGVECDYDSKIIFDQSDRCDIYDNYALYFGNDLYTSRFLEVYVDTFSVQDPTNFHAYPIDSFAFDINYGLLAQTSQDLYISPDGNNFNDGLTIDSPLRNIHTALSKSLAGDMNRQTVFLAEGTYSSSTTGEHFPIRPIDYVTIAGTAAGKTILDAEGQESRVIDIRGISTPAISDLTITGGGDGGLYCSSSDLHMQNIIIRNNHGASRGGGASFYNECYPVLKNVVVIDNCTDVQGDEGIGGGLYFTGCSPVIINSTVINNKAEDAGGIYFNMHPMYMGGYDAYIKNTIIWNNEPNQGYLYSWGSEKGLWISWSDIMGGENSIECVDTSSLHWLEENIDVDPLFVQTGDFPYALAFGSPCIDAGIEDTTGLYLPLYDIMGGPRIWNGRVDIGAMEWNNLGIEKFQVPGSKFQVSCYPNPTKGIVDFRFSILDSRSVSLKIYDVHGRVVAVVLDGKWSGDQVVRWDASSLPAGIYFYRLTILQASTSGQANDQRPTTFTGKILVNH
jgi:predicted outer membrane repeat protein